MRQTLSTWFLLLSFLTITTAQSPITIEDIYQKNTFRVKSVPGFNFRNDGKHYTTLEDNILKEYDLISGQMTKALLKAADLKDWKGNIDAYTFSQDERKVLLSTGTESIYRRSTKAIYAVLDMATGTLTPLFSGAKQSFATFNPQGDKVAFVSENNLYYTDLATGKTTQVTTDGKKNQVINGASDWVYEEEFSLTKSFWWSGDGHHLAYLRFDETRVREFTLQNYKNEMYPQEVTFKYPKVGEENAIIGVFIYDLNTEKTVVVQTGFETDIYIPRVVWTQDPGQVCVFKMNRHQNQLELLLADAATGKTSLLLKEVNDRYINIHDNLTFLKDGKRFLWSSEKSGYNHLYLYDMSGKELAAVTKGDFDVTNVYGADEGRGRVYYQAAKKTPMDREIYSVGLMGQDDQLLQGAPGTNSAQFSKTFDYYVLTYSTINSAPVYTVHDRTGLKIRAIEDNAGLAAKQQEFGATPIRFFNFNTADGVTLNGWMMQPPHFKKKKKHPVLMFLYGGPGSQEVVNAWKSQYYWWFQMLAQKGYIIACVDGRGTGGRGEDFKKITYLRLGHYETLDQIEAARWLAAQPYVDGSRIGIFGWSYGGFLSSSCLLKGNGVFKAAIAVAPVTNWKWYDSIYTERFMRTEQENPEGYRDNSPVNFADKLRGNYLLIHGLGDDNVHFQHSAEMVNALISANKQFDAEYYPNRAHGISGGNTRLHLFTKMTDFVLNKI